DRSINVNGCSVIGRIRCTAESRPEICLERDVTEHLQHEGKVHQGACSCVVTPERGNCLFELNPTRIVGQLPSESDRAHLRLDSKSRSARNNRLRPPAASARG